RSSVCGSVTVSLTRNDILPVRPLGHPHRIWAPLIVGTISLALTLTAWWLLTRREEDLLPAQFQIQSEERFPAIEAKFNETLPAAYVPQAFYEATENVSETDFRAFVRPLSNRYPGIIAFLWVSRVQGAPKESFKVVFAEPRETTQALLNWDLMADPVAA